MIHMTPRTAIIILWAAAFIALILTVVFVILLITSPKEKRREMKKVKISVCCSAAIMAVSCILLPFAIIERLNEDICIMPLHLADLTGLDYEECKEAFPYYNLTAEWEYSSEYPAGAIISQYPLSGSYPVDSIDVSCVVSKGVRMMEVPDITGVDFETAERLCMEHSIFLEMESEEYSDKYLSGAIVLQSPEYGEKIEVNGTIICTVSKGKESDDSE